ncbi:hypothetical protein [Burkholderia pyrrocinia]|uniref:hypothetical protein n=1 Tax=Burkholderia pyrrocinia TaxID=60550 RepID=UPI00158D5CE9|nr:hypothetical protein [Burkholderia pyrrocinia]
MDALRTRRRPASDARSRKRMRLVSITVNAAIVTIRSTGELEVRVFTDALTLGRNGPTAA